MDKQKNLVNTLRKFKAVIYDLDGTLVDLGTRWGELKAELSSFTHIHKQIDIQYSPLDITLLEMKSKFGSNFYKELLEIVTRHEMKEADYKINRELQKYINNSEQPFAIYSMNTNRCITNFVNKHLSKKPNVIVSKETCQEPKPSGKDLNRIVSTLAMEKKELIYVGNTNYDKQSGDYANIQTILI